MRGPFSNDDLAFPGQYVSRRGTEAEVHTHAGSEVCDFCGSSEELVAAYGCDDHTIMQTPIQTPEGPRIEDHNSVGGWLACKPCAFLVDRRERKQLAERAAREARERHPEFAQVSMVRLRRAMLAAHATFWAHRDGTKQDWPRPEANRHGKARRPVPGEESA